jgi:hypothetical protein
MEQETIIVEDRDLPHGADNGLDHFIQSSHWKLRHSWRRGKWETDKTLDNKNIIK